MNESVQKRKRNLGLPNPCRSIAVLWQPGTGKVSAVKGRILDILCLAKLAVYGVAAAALLLQAVEFSLDHNTTDRSYLSDGRSLLLKGHKCVGVAFNWGFVGAMDDATWQTQFHRWGVPWAYYVQMRAWPKDLSLSPTVEFSGVILDYRLFLVPPAILPAISLRSDLRKWRRRRRARLGLCPFCAYDLRASQGRCPECGTPIVPQVAQRPIN